MLASTAVEPLNDLIEGRPEDARREGLPRDHGPLSADKDAVLREAFRVLKPGGRFAVSDVVIEGEIPDAVRKDMEAYVGCVAGALEKDEYLARLKKTG